MEERGEREEDEEREQQYLRSVRGFSIAQERSRETKGGRGGGELMNPAPKTHSRNPETVEEKAKKKGEKGRLAYSAILLKISPVSSSARG